MLFFWQCRLSPENSEHTTPSFTSQPSLYLFQKWVTNWDNLQATLSVWHIQRALLKVPLSHQHMNQLTLAEKANCILGFISNFVHKEKIYTLYWSIIFTQPIIPNLCVVWVLLNGYICATSLLIKIKNISTIPPNSLMFICSQALPLPTQATAELFLSL